MPFDTTTFVRASINDSVEDRFEAAILVLIVSSCSCRTGRHAGPMTRYGHHHRRFAPCGASASLSTCRLCSPSACIGIVVDDAVVVVGRSTHIDGAAPKEAAIRPWTSCSAYTHHPRG